MKSYLGLAQVDITPPEGYPRPEWGGQSLPGRRGDLPLMARAAVFAGLDQSVALISLDLCAVGRGLRDRIARAMPRLSGGKDLDLLLACSHTHEAPLLIGETQDDSYSQWLVESLATLAQEAYERRVPIQLEFASKDVTGLSRNRRRKDAEVDSRLSVLVARNDSARPVACLWHFSAHPLIRMNDPEIWSPDFPGVVARQVERTLDGIHCQFLQGAAGDVFPLDWYFGQESSRYPMGRETEHAVGVVLAGHLQDLIARSEPLAEFNSPVATMKEISLESRAVSWSEEEASQLAASLEAEIPQGYEPWGADDHVGNIAQNHEKRYQFLGCVNAARFARVAGKPIPCLLAVLRIANLVLIFLPGELFAEDALRLRRRYPGYKVLVICYANDYLGYLPTRRDMQEVAGWSLQEFIDQKKNRWAYGATTTTQVSEDSAERILAAIDEELASLRPNGR